MKDGHFINDKGKYEYNEQLPYAQRDPRLEYTIIHNGSSWVNSTMETWQGGANNPLGSSYSLTSYYMRKFMGDFEAANEYQDTQHNWVMFRYAEILLNFAEAENEYLSTPSQAVYDAIIALRRRAGIEPGEKNLYGLTTDGLTHNLTQAEMRKVNWLLKSIAIGTFVVGDLPNRSMHSLFKECTSLNHRLPRPTFRKLCSMYNGTINVISIRFLIRK